jgi:thiamine-monophosphate kinase
MTTTESGKTPIGDLGKFGLIDHLTKDAKLKNKSTVAGTGDDCAIIENGALYTLKHLGYKTVIRGISDIFAMNGKPGQIFISIGVSTRFSLEQLEELYEGIYLACEKYGTDLAGGDTTSSLTGLTIGVTAVGKVEKKSVVKRDGARPNDLICVSGDFGASFLGLQLLERERKLFNPNKDFQPDFSGYEYVIGRQLKPEFPFEIINELSKNDLLPTSMIDISDGLASDLLHICKSSETGCRIHSNKIPVDQETFRLADELRIDPLTAALNGGEDYELLFTLPLEMFNKINQIQNVKIIGHMTTSDKGKYLVAEDGTEVRLSAQGWRINGDPG